MKLKELIAKFLKEGLAALSEEEKDFLENNKSYMTPSQRANFEKSIDESDEEEEEEDEDEEEEEDEDEGIDEKALKKMISKKADVVIKSKAQKALKNIDEIADQLVEKFLAGVKEQRAKVLETDGKGNVEKGRKETQKFLKALFHNDKQTLVEMQKATTFNYGGSDSRGGYTVPDELRAEILRIAEKQYGLARREMTYLPFSGPGNDRKIPTLSSSVSVSWVDEAGAKPGTNPVFGVVTQTLKKLAAIIPFTEELLEDSAINLTQLVAELFAEAVSKEEDAQFFYGTGSPWTGILNNGSVNTVDLATGVGVSGVSIEKLIDMQDECPSGAMVGAKYYMNRQIFTYIRKLRADAVSASDGKGMFLLPPSKRDIEEMLGYPIELSDSFPGKTLTGANKPFVVFGNLKVAAIFGDKQQIRAKFLDQATITDGDGTTTINLAEQDMVAIRLEERVGYVLALPTAIVVLRTGAAS